MRLRIDRLVAGPSLWADRPVLLAELTVPPGLGRVPSGRVEELFRALDTAAPKVAAERQASMPPLPPLPPQASAGVVVARIAALLQRWVGHAIEDFGARGETIWWGYELARCAMAAGQVATRVLWEASRATSGGLGPEGRRAIEGFLQYVEKPYTVSFIEAARRRGIPWRATVDGESYVDVGHGWHRQRFLGFYTGNTTHLAKQLSTHKGLANAIFRAHGLPVPAQAIVEQADQAVQAARTLGFPVVVKPTSRDLGTAVHVDLRSDDEVRAAFADARQYGDVLVEKLIPGEHHRLMVIHGRFTSGRRQRAAHVVGDGTRTVRALVEATNRDRTARGWKPVPSDAEAQSLLARQGLSPDAVPAADRLVFLRSQGNLSQGGSMEVVTASVHPDNALLAVRAAAVMGIDLAGVDFITTDITRSWLEVGGALCEINVTPGLILGEEDVILADLFPDGDGRIPTIAVLDPADAGVGRHIARALAAEHAPVCHAGQGGVWLGDAKIAAGDHATAAGARIALWEPTARAAVVEVRSEAVNREGLGFDRCTLAVAPPSASADALRLLAAHAGQVVPPDAWEAALASISTTTTRPRPPRSEPR